VFEETTADRLTLVSNVHELYFEPPVFVKQGETFWVEGRALHVRNQDGAVYVYPARKSRPDDMR
jgi:hypothetical protein